MTTFQVKERRGKNGYIDPNIFLHHHSQIYIRYGSFILTIAILIFVNGANSQGKFEQYNQGVIAVNTIVAYKFSVLTSFFLYYQQTLKLRLVALFRGCVARIVAILAMVDDVRIWQSAFIGVLAGIVYSFLILVIKRSPIDAYTIASHLGPSLLGTILVGFLSPTHSLMTGHGSKKFGLQGSQGVAYLIPQSSIDVFKIHLFQETQRIDISYGAQQFMQFLAEGEAIQLLDYQPVLTLISKFSPGGNLAMINSKFPSN